MTPVFFSNKKSKKNRVLALIPILIFLGIWEITVRLGVIPGRFFFPPFSQVLAHFGELIYTGVLPINLLASLFRVLAGFILGGILGLTVGILMGCCKKLESSLSPIISLLCPIPALGWLPLLMLWLGIGEALPITIVFICSFFPILYNTVSGIKGVDEDFIDVARTLGAGKLEIIRRILIPLALPSIFTGLRLEAGMAWRVIIAAEMVAIPTGIGALLLKSESLLRIDTIIVCLMVLALFSFLFERCFAYWEQRLVCYQA